MKRTVKILKHSKFADIVINEKGDCYDLIACEDCTITPHKAHLISLGISMKLPSGCVAKIYDRSSTPLKKFYFLANSVGYIDNSYSGNDDIWKYQALAIKSGHSNPVTIHKGDRICQFEICLSQKATIFDKLKWLFTSGYKFKEVNCLKEINRNGFGEGTGE